MRRRRCHINVNQATPTITWATPAAITYGTALSGTQLNATGSVAGTLVYSPAAGTMLSAGASQTLSVTLTPTDTVDYTNATATVSINVNQATPTITWATPAAITYGTALSSTQLECNGVGGGYAGVQSGGGHGAERRCRPDVERDVDADGHGGLHERRRRRCQSMSTRRRRRSPGQRRRPSPMARP